MPVFANFISDFINSHLQKVNSVFSDFASLVNDTS